MLCKFFADRSCFNAFGGVSHTAGDFASTSKLFSKKIFYDTWAQLMLVTPTDY